jgi:hypothetical protein
MKPSTLGLAALALAIALPLGAAALAQDGGAGGAPAKKAAEPDDGIRRTEKARRLLKASNWLEQTKAAVTARVEEQEKRGALPAGAAAKFQEVVDWDELLQLAVASYVKNVDEDAMDAAIVFYESPEGQKFAKHQPAMVRAGAMATSEFVDRTSMKAVESLAKVGIKDKAKGLWGKVTGSPESNEKGAIELLRTLATSQASLAARGKIDCDDDGIGEFGTFLELMGTAGIRKDGGWSAKGGPVVPPAMSPKTGTVDENGVLTKSGYCFRIFLPAEGAPAGFVHETGPADKAGLAGGKVATDLAETAWCAYAWPEKHGETGNRVFFVSHAGDVMHASNDVANWNGAAKAPPGGSIFRGAGMTSPIAVGTTGNDGNVWKVCE